MVTGIDKFREQFSAFEGMYTLIGGVACGLLMDDAGLDFRATKDFDMVLIIEALTEDFGRSFWQFIKDGGYEIREKSNGEPMFYRFRNPKNTEYPKEIELFSRKSDVLVYDENDRLTPIHISDDLSSLSAILLNDEYYNFLKNGLTLINGIQTLNYTHIIPFKAKAWLDLNERKDNGDQVDSKNILKHKRDVFRLSQLISEEDKVVLPDDIRIDMENFIAQMSDEDIVLKDIGVSGTKAEIIDLLEKVYLNANNNLISK